LTSKPTGTVTFLFTDIEESTRLAREYSDRWERVRSRHHEILRESIEQNDGFVFQIIGDAFCSSFHKAIDALKAAIQAQQGLQQESWGEAIVRVRMGIHTGEAETDGSDYRGYLTMSLVQRLMSSGHGGQILLSDATEKLSRDRLPEDVRLLDMGEHKFKGIAYPVRVFQVLAPHLQQEFSPIHTPDFLPNNLPAQLTSFVGRKKELEEVSRLLQNTHLLTLIGPGGTGKTRLSIQAASEMLDRYPDGVWLVELAPITEPALVPRTTAIAIGLRDEPQRPVIDTLYDFLREKKMLIILDNCEHLVGACAQMADGILHAAPHVRILASSREALGIPGEVTYRVPSLGLPDIAHIPTIESLSQFDAVKLFIDRATSAIPSFEVTKDNAPALAQICYRLDGIPLAIELAAAKIRVLSVEQIARRLDDRFKLLTGSSRAALERHQTLRAAIDWSYQLLPAPEQVLFKRLSVFVGGCTLEAAESVCADASIEKDDVLNLLEQLINKSLVIKEEGEEEPRYHMLETIRQYAHERLAESGENALVRERHLDYYVQFAEDMEARRKTAGQMLAIRQSKAEFDNFRVARAWSLGDENGKNCEKGLRLANAIDWEDNSIEEGLHWLQKGLAQLDPGNPASDLIRAKAMTWAGHLMISNNDSQAALTLLEESLALYHAIDPADKRDLTMLLTELAYVFLDSDLAVAQTYAQESVTLGRSLGSSGKWELTWALYWDSCVAYRQNNNEFARAQAREALAISRSIGDSLGAAAMLELLGWIEDADGNYEAARSKLQEAYQIFSSLGLENYAIGTLYWIATFDRLAGHYETARSILEEVESYERDRGNKVALRATLLNLGETLSNLGEYERAAIYLRESLRLLQPTKDPRFKGYAILSCAKILYHQGHSQTAARLLGAVESETHKEVWKLVKSRMEDYMQTIESVKAALGEEAYHAEWEAGRQMDLDQALELSLSTVDEMIESKLPSDKDIKNVSQSLPHAAHWTSGNTAD
jgi:predicted ATPase/class 3 adenylate cyclase